MMTSDITGKKIPKGRITDPNRPTYRIHGLEIQDDKFAKPKEPKNFITDNFLLKTRDINCGDVESSVRFCRREVKNTNFIQDIDGAQVDSVKHSIVTNRITNPLQPIYQCLDDGKDLLPLIPPLIPEQLIKFPQLKRRGSWGIQATEANNSSSYNHNSNTLQGEVDVRDHCRSLYSCLYLATIPHETQYSISANNTTPKYSYNQQAEIDLVRSLP